MVESLKRLACTLLAIFQTRLDLLSSEIEEERLRIEQMLLYGSIALFFFGLGTILLTALIVVLLWDSYRLQVLIILTGVYFVAGLLAWNALRRAATKKSKLFSASLAELDDDLDRLAPWP